MSQLRRGRQAPPPSANLWSTRVGSVVGLLLWLSLGDSPALANEASPAGAPRLLISGVYLHGFLPGVPNADTAVRIVNLDPDRPALLTDYGLSDAFTPRKRRKSDEGKDPLLADDAWSLDEPEPAKPSRGRPKSDRVIRFPDGAVIPPGGEIWVAATGTGFSEVFGEAPHFEANATDPKVPDMVPAEGFLWLNEGYGTVALVDRRGYAIDFVAWQGPKQNAFGDEAFDDVPWKGGPVALRENTPFGWTGRVLGRARDEQGKVLADTDRATDWPVGFSAMALGALPTHRVELAGQSRFVARPIKGVRAKVVATSAPDNNFAALIAAVDSAKRELRVRVYEFTNPKIADALIRAKKRGVRVLLFLEGSPVGGLSDQSRWLSTRMSKAGIPIHYLATPKGSPMAPRYRYDHSKYVLVDDRLAIIGTENYGRTGVPVNPTFGNRGWMIHVENPDFVRQLREVWDHDYRPGKARDLIAIDDKPDDSYGMPYRDPSFVPSEKIPTGLYPRPEKPTKVDDVMDLELVLAPDTSLNESSAIIGMIKRAKTSLILEQNSVLPFWGKKKKADTKDKDGGRESDRDEDDEVRPASLPLQAVIAAARRGVSVRVLLDGTWYNAENVDERDNDNTVKLLNDLRLNEGLDVSAKVINLESTHLDKIHSKGVIVDDREVFVGSINWSENSFLGNREVGVIVSHRQVAGYYADLFRRDWSQSRLYASTLASAANVHAEPNAQSRVLGNRAANTKVDVVDERWATKGELAWVEVALGLGETGFVAASHLGVPEATAFEAQYIIGREAIVTARVVGIRASEKVLKVSFADEERPPFTAVIFAKDLAAFKAAGVDPTTAFAGKTLRMRGRVKVYKVPEIVLNRPGQVEILP